MINEMLTQLRKFDQTENVFGKDLIDAIEFGECSDAYVVRVNAYPAVVLRKEDKFETNYFMLIHYLTDIKNQVMNGEEPHNETVYYHDWLIFKQSYNLRKAWFWLNVKDAEAPQEVIELLVSILGEINYKAVISLYNTKNTDYHTQADIIMEYLGNTRAVRDLSMKYLDPKLGIQWQFHLWNMMAYFIIDHYGQVFYLGNELSSLDYCPYGYRAKEYYYNAFYERLYLNLKKDIPKNEGITQQQKEAIREEINREIGCNISSDEFTDDEFIFDLEDEDDWLDLEEQEDLDFEKL